MRITVAISGFYDWTPCPPGTEITEADVRSLRVKKMSDDRYYMRIEQAARDGAHHDVGIPELSVCQRMAALAKLGRGKARHAVVAELLQSSLQHHLDDEHIRAIIVDGAEPDRAMYMRALEAAEVPEKDRERLADKYAGGKDLQEYLRALFGVQAEGQ